MVDYCDLIARLRAPLASEETMRAWDHWRRLMTQTNSSLVRDFFEAWCDLQDEERTEAATALEALSARERVLREALKPFATALDDWGDDTGQPDRWTAWEHPIAMNVTLGDFRRARASLDPLSIAEKGV